MDTITTLTTSAMEGSDRSILWCYSEITKKKSMKQIDESMRIALPQTNIPSPFLSCERASVMASEYGERDEEEEVEKDVGEKARESGIRFGAKTSPFYGW